MAFDIFKPEEQIQMPVLDTAVVSVIIAEGIKAGAIVDLHSCVEHVNANIDPDIGGNEVQDMFKAVLAEAKKMNSAADAAVLLDQTIDDGVYFTYADIEAFKIKQYGSVEEWKVAVSPEEVV